MQSLRYLESEALSFESCDREIKEINSFKKFVKSCGPFGAVVDGMNVSYFHTRRNVGRVWESVSVNAYTYCLWLLYLK